MALVGDCLPQTQFSIDTSAVRVLRTISGYALDKWNYRYVDGVHGPYSPNSDDHKNQFALSPGAFNESLASGREVLLTMDLAGVDPFARLSDGTLRVTSDEIGLLVEADLLDTPRNRALCRLIDAGKIRGWSHAFEALAGYYRDRQVGDVVLTEIHRANLHEVCLVVNKRPRQRERTTPIFLTGGPRQVSETTRPTLIKHCCCQTVESGGDVIHVCAEMLASECASLGGNFLGAGTRCWLEGCGVCIQPGDCSTLCDEFSLHFQLVAPVGCVAFPATDITVTLTRDADPTDGCTWTATSGSWSFSLSINIGTSPPTKTLTATYSNGEDSIIVTAESTNGYCEAPTISLAIIDYVANICDSDPPSAATILLTQLAGCPDFLP